MPETETRTAPLPLLPHPGNPGAAARRLEALAELAAPLILRLRYELEADPSQVRIPAPVAAGGRAERLWAHTCFEAFLRPEGSAAYLELNFSPSGQWAAYRFESYRQGMAPADMEEPPRLSVRQAGDRLQLQAEVRLRGALPAGPLCMAVSAVVEDGEGRLSYWALRHPPGRPDFHHPGGFSLALELPRNPAA